MNTPRMGFEARVQQLVGSFELECKCLISGKLLQQSSIGGETVNVPMKVTIIMNEANILRASIVILRWDHKHHWSSVQ